MIRPSRREFCSIAAALGTSALIAPNKLLAQPAALQISLVIDPAIRLAEVPADFMGLSYESGQLTYPDFFSPQNSALIQMFRTLSPAGVLRLGGNLSEFTPGLKRNRQLRQKPADWLDPIPVIASHILLSSRHARSAICKVF